MSPRWRNLPHGLVAVAALLALACRQTPIEMEPEHFRVAGEARVEIDGELSLPGRFEAEYALGDGQRVGGQLFRAIRLRELRAWIHDTNLVVPRLGRDRSFPLRCTTLALNAPASGTTTTAPAPAAAVVSFPSGAVRFLGLSHERRSEAGGCPGSGARLAFGGTNARALAGQLDPLGDRFELEGRFEVELEGERYRGRLELSGNYLNRPPVAIIATNAPPLFDRSQGGCPPLTSRNPEGVDSNSPEGLRMELQSVSYDPDGESSRSDLRREQWAHFVGSPTDPAARYEVLGHGRRLGSRLFEAGHEHTVILGVSDRQNARREARCTFYVRPPL